MATLRTIRGVVFDLDGTLIDSLADIAGAVNLVLERLGYPTHSIEVFRDFIGEGVDALARKTLPAGLDDDPERVAQLVDGFRQEYQHTWDRHTNTYAGIPELLDTLTSRQVRLGVLSNKPHRFTCRCVDRFLARWPFNPVFGERSGIPRKPSPVGATEIASAWAMDPGAIAYLGDTGVDMETARLAGMTAVGVSWGFRSADALRRAGADMVIDHPGELLSRFQF